MFDRYAIVIISERCAIAKISTGFCIITCRFAFQNLCLVVLSCETWESLDGEYIWPVANPRMHWAGL
jgi:hypothetical protein